MDGLNVWLVLATLVLGAVAVFIFKFLRQYIKLRAIFNKISGPEDLFLLGNSLQIQHGYRAYEQFMEWCGSYKGIFRIWAGTAPQVFITNPEAAQVLKWSSVDAEYKLYNSADESLIGGTKHTTKSYLYKLVSPWLGTGLLISDGNKWKLRRKIITPAFHYRILNNFIQVFEEQAEILVAQLQSKVDGEPFDIFPYMGRCALDIICETSMGKSRKAQENKDTDYVKAVIRISELIFKRITKPWLWPSFAFNLSTLGREQKKCLQILHGFTNKVIDEQIQEMRSKIKTPKLEETVDINETRRKKKKLSFLDLLLECFEEGTIDREGIREEVDTFMFEGHDTTASGMSWALYLLGRHPDIQEKLYEEVEGFLACPRDGLAVDDLKELRYLECVIKESLRLFPPVPLFTRTLTEDSTIYGHFLPAGHIAGICVAGMHRDPEIWPEPLKFDPDRFLPENSSNRHPYAYLPFSAGPRNCIGQRFAIMEEKVVLLTLIRHFRIESIQAFDEIKPTRMLILRPKDGIIVKLSPRH